MKKHAVTLAVALTVGAAMLSSPARGQSTSSRRDFDAEIESEIRAAKAAAGSQHLATLTTLCLLPTSGRLNTAG